MRLIGCWVVEAEAANGLFQAATADFRHLRRAELPAGTPLAVSLAPHKRDLGWASAPDGSAVFVDGEVYSLSDGSAPSDSSAAARAILSLYARRGTDILPEINSAAAIAIWDAGRQKLILVRDRAGLGLCYFMEREGALFWASDLATLLRIDSRTELDMAAVDHLLAGGFVPAPWTTLAHIRKLPAAHLLEVGRDGVRLQRYWWPQAGAKRNLPDSERRQRLDGLLEQAVRRRLPERRKAAVLLSGGVDSTLLLTYLTRRCGAAAETYTYRYEGYDGPFNEGVRARRAAQYCGVPHHEIVFRPDHLIEHMDRILIEHHGPMTYGVHTSLLHQIVSSGAEVLFGGHGADSFFYSKTEQAGLRLGRWPGPAARLVGWAAAAMHPFHPQFGRQLEYAALVARTSLTWRFHARLTPPRLRAALYEESARMRQGQAAAEGLYRPEVETFSAHPESDRLPLVTQRFYAPEGALHWTQSFARGSGLVARCPYVDNDVVDFLFSLPRVGGKKDELRDLAAMVMPQELALAKKIGQTLPMAAWLRGPLAEFMREGLAPSRLERAGVFRPEAVQRLVDRHLRGEANHCWTLWSLLAVTHWHEIVRRLAGRGVGAKTAAA